VALVPGRTVKVSRKTSARAFLLCCIMSAFGTKRTSRSTQLMSAFGGKADIGWRSPKGRAARKRPLKKLRTQKGSLFCAFKTKLGGLGWVICRFSRSPDHFAFFHAVQAPLRVSQNDSSGQAVFLGQLVEELVFLASYEYAFRRERGECFAAVHISWALGPKPDQAAPAIALSSGSGVAEKNKLSGS
jgi:hypothetical protein